MPASHLFRVLILLVAGAGLYAAPARAAAACNLTFTGPQVIEDLGNFAKVLIDDDCRYIYAANFDKARVDVISIATRRVTARIPVGPQPRSLAISLDGTTLYVLNYASGISVVDLSRNAVVNTIPIPADPSLTFNQPVDIVVAANGKLLLSIDTVVKEYNAASNTFFTRTDYGTNGGMYLFAQRFFANSDRSIIFRGSTTDGTYRYTAGTDSFSGPMVMTEADFIVIDRSGNTVLSNSGDVLTPPNYRSIGRYTPCCGTRTPIYPSAVGIDPEGATGYFLSQGLEVIDLATRQKTGTLSYGATLPVALDGDGILFTNPLTVSRDGTLLVLRTTAGFTLMRAADRNPLPTPTAPTAGVCAATVRTQAIDIDGDIGGLLIDDQCRNLYVSNTTRNRIDVISLATSMPVARIPVGARPMGLDTSPDGKTLYVANSGSGNISVVDLTQGRELRRVMVPGTASAGAPDTVAVANTGLVLVSMRMNLPAQQSIPENNRLVTFDPQTDFVIGLPVVVTSGAAKPGNLHLKASGDRSVIAIADEGTPGRLHRFEAAARQVVLDENIPGAVPVADAAPDPTGANTVAGTGQVFNAFGQQVSALPVPAARTAVAVWAGTAYTATAGANALGVFNIASHTSTGSLPVGALVKASAPAVTASRDGTVLAVATNDGFALVRADGQRGPETLGIQTALLSTANADGNQSYLRLFNSGSSAGTAHVTLRDPATNAVLGQWVSPSIAPGAAPQFGIGVIETASGILSGIISKPAVYAATVAASFQGTLTQLLLNSGNGTIADLTTCSGGGGVVENRIANLHSTRIGADYPSYISLANTGQAASDPVMFGITDASTGQRLGTANMGPIAAGEGRLYSNAQLEQAAGIVPATGQYHYTVALESTFTGRMQHFIQNRSPGEVTDFTAVCRLSGW